MEKKQTKRKNWREKMANPAEPQLVEPPAAWVSRYGPGPMLISTPRDIDALLRTLNPGELISVKQVRSHLAEAFGANSTCPLTTGIFLRIVAEVAEEDLQAGMAPVTPYWRVVQDDGGMNPRFPGGVELQSARLAEEGHEIEPGKGKKPPRVKGFQPAA
jgi:hypothetical protein